MKVLLTGSSGMVGRNILEHPDSKHFNFLTPSSLELNLLDKSKVNDYLENHQPDMIIHTAGRVGGIQANLREPVRFFIENLEMSTNIILSARKNGITKFLNLGSSCMYPKDVEGFLNEDFILKGQLEPTNEGYALAKISASRLCEYIMLEEKIYQYKTLIPCNLYGRWDKFDPNYSHMIPAVIHKIHSAVIDGKTDVEIWGDGTVRREFMYAGDLADCVIRAIDHFEELPNIMNIGLGYDYEVLEYYQAIAEIIGYKGNFIFNLNKPVGMRQKLLDVDRQIEWGWRSKTSLKQGLLNTYKFYLENYIKS